MNRVGLPSLVALLSLLPTVGRALEAPELRIGLATQAEDVLVSCGGGRLLLAGGEGAFRPVVSPIRLAVRPRPPAERGRWFVDVRSERDPAQARLVAEALEPTIGRPLSVLRREDRHVIVAGPFDAREPAERLRDLLIAAGMAEALLREERVEGDPPSRLVRVDPHWTVEAVPSERVRLVAEGDARLSVDGRRYRGEVEIFVSGPGRLTVVNAVGLEDYLRGVVPEELGPDSFPAVEALATQAVAARTWVLTQLGRHASEGFDTCATAHCQVYGGASSEHELSDRAVTETAGLVLSWDDGPATAYFSSTCGGHTEAVENVFDHPAVPYLAGVPCYPESVAFTTVDGRRIEADWARVDGTSADDVLARAWAVGVVADEELGRGGFARRARRDESVAWLRRAAARAGRGLEPAALERFDVETAIGFLRSLQSALGWSSRRALLAPADLAAAARFAELEGLKGDDLAVGLLAVKGGLLPPGLGAGWAAGRMDRGHVLEVLDLWLETRGVYAVPALRFLGRDGDALTVLDAGERRSLRLEAAPALLSGRKDRRPRSRETLSLKLSDKLRLLGPLDGAARAVLVEEDPDGAAFDRTSVYSWWERRQPFEAVARAARERAGVDHLRDLRIARVSPAGRVSAVELLGRGGESTLLEGFPARGLLGLPDVRAHVEVERDASGRPVAVRATGRGWGHGVGLCQFGAYGMALAGRSRESILAHYYPGARLRPLEELPERPAAE